MMKEGPQAHVSGYTGNNTIFGVDWKWRSRYLIQTRGFNTQEPMVNNCYLLAL